MEKIIYYGNKNKYGYTTIQLKIDYENKTYEVGHFKQSVDKLTTRKAINEKIEELNMLGFNPIIKIQ